MPILEITKENFQTEVLECEKPVLLDFWAPWCGFCHMISPTVDEIAAERPDIKVGKVNIDGQIELARQFSIRSIPALVVIKNGKMTNSTVGAVPKDKILALLD